MAAINALSILSFNYQPLTRPPKRRIIAASLPRPATTAPTVPASTNKETSSSSDSTPLAPYWQDFRLQVGRMEGLRGLPLPPELQRRICTYPAVAVRSGVFHSDRLRLGWFIFITLDDGSAVLLGALHPTVYSHHPPYIFELAFLEPAGWVVSFDFPRLFPSEVFSEEQQKENYDEDFLDAPEDDNTSNRNYSPNKSTDSDIYKKLAKIKEECGSLAVPMPQEFIESQPFTSESACLLSSTQLTKVAGKSTSAATRSREAFEGPALQAFKQALAVHLNGLVGAPLEASPDAVAQVAQAHADFAASRAGKEFLGSDALEAAFGPAWLSRLRAVVLDDAYDLARHRAKMKSNKTSSNGGEVAQSAGAEFYYIDPRLR